MGNKQKLSAYGRQKVDIRYTVPPLSPAVVMRKEMGTRSDTGLLGQILGQLRVVVKLGTILFLL